MAGAAHSEAQAFDNQLDPAHEPAHELAPERSSPSLTEANGKAGDAAIRRMMQGEHNVGGPGDATATAKAPSAGDSGMITDELKVELDGNQVTVPPGTVVEVKAVRGAKELLCKLYSSFGGKEAVVPLASFKAEPGLTHKEDPGHTSEPQDFTYQEYTSVLWDGAPKATDVAQGYIGDCYLMSAMGAVAAANPSAIQKLFSPATPNQKQYNVTLYMRTPGGAFKAHTVSVDTNLPTRLQDAQRNAPIYALMGKSFSDHQTPIWPALLEKAYAQLMGGYDVIGEGGPPERAMEALTGVESNSESIPRNATDVITRFKEYQKAGQAVVCGTLDSKQARSQAGFEGNGDGPFGATLKSDEGGSVEIVQNTLSVYDKDGKAPRSHDDGDGKMAGGGATGDVNYGDGTVSVKYPDAKGPAKADDLRADYQWRGVLDKALNVHAWHAYMFESVTPDGKLQFKNPWGVEHPLPMTAADFQRLFTGIDSNPVTPRRDPGR